MSVYATCVCRWPLRPEKGIQFPGVRVTDGFEPCNMDLKNKLWSLQKHRALLATEQSLQHPVKAFLFITLWQLSVSFGQAF